MTPSPDFGGCAARGVIYLRKNPYAYTNRRAQASLVVVLDTGFFPEKEADFRATVLCELVLRPETSRFSRGRRTTRSTRTTFQLRDLGSKSRFLARHCRSLSNPDIA
jgi:hypothetical protein